MKKTGDGIKAIDFNGQPAWQLSIANGAQAIVSQQGAQVLSWRMGNGHEWLYLSPQADHSGQTAIRGGIPVCFPQFAMQGPLPKHGLVRTRPWSLQTKRSDADYALLTLAREADADSLAHWPHAFRAELSIGLEAERLDLELEISNTGSTPFTFTTALHTYLRVSEVEEMTLEGLRGCRYLDADGEGNHRTEQVESGTTVVIDRVVDRLYCQAPSTLLLRDGGHVLGIHREHLPDTVVWNPWQGHGLPDLPERDFRHMLCVEAAAVAQQVTLEPGNIWWGRQTLIDLSEAARKMG